MYKLIIFGAGAIANYLSERIKADKVEIVVYIDNINNSQGVSINGVPVVALDKIVQYQYDYVIIGFSDVMKGFRALEEYGVPKEKIVAYAFANDKCDYRQNYWQNEINRIMHNELNDEIITELFQLPVKNNYLCSMYIEEEQEVIERDFVREQTLALIAKEIRRKGLRGNVAELGVYKGSFSKKINYLFPDKLLYMFDTFEGFDTRDILCDDKAGEGAMLTAFNDTTVELVLQNMPHKEKCIIKKGFFPDTFDLENEEFSFVSIDADLYSPIKRGLEIFYPRLVPGGMIMVHDYNNIVYNGTTDAVIEYCDGNGIPYVPIPDICGSVIITKS